MQGGVWSNRSFYSSERDDAAAAAVVALPLFTFLLFDLFTSLSRISSGRGYPIWPCG